MNLFSSLTCKLVHSRLWKNSTSLVRPRTLVKQLGPPIRYAFEDMPMQGKSAAHVQHLTYVRLLDIITDEMLDSALFEPAQQQVQWGSEEWTQMVGRKERDAKIFYDRL